MSLSTSGSDGRVLRRADPSTIHDKFMVGYQGWFTCAGDGEQVGPGHHGWLHWFNYPVPDGGRPNTDLWPDVSEYSASELYPVPGLRYKSGEQVSLFSSRNAQTVQRHFHWMAQHGVDGAFLQRFATEVESDGGIKKIRDEVCDRVREAAEKEGRVFAIMYDVTGVPAERIQQVLQRDWIHLWRVKRILDSPAYLREKGKPVVALCGFGFSRRSHTPELLRRIAHLFRNSTPSSAYIFGGAPAHWRTGTGDADPDPGFVDAWMDGFDAICPWTVGRYKTVEDVDRWGEEMIKRDMDFIQERNARVGEEGRGRKVDYVPVVLPGGSGFNVSEGKWAFNDIKRNGGKFLWQQIFNAKRHGARIIYGAMWDEYDEGTAFLPVVAKKRQLPESNKFPFMALDEDGFDLPPDWYMRICGFAAEGLRSERMIHETFPSKELQDYWSTRPKYEGDPAPASVGGSSSTAASGSSSGSGSGEGGASEAYAQWLSQQKEEKDEPPPPPYSLEAAQEAATPATDLASQQARPEPASPVSTMSSRPLLAPHTSVPGAGSAAPSGQAGNNQPQSQGYGSHSSSTPGPAPRPASRPGTVQSYSQSPGPSMPSIQALTDDFGRQSIGPGPTPASPPWSQQQEYTPGPTTSPQPWQQQQQQPYPQMTSPPPGQGHCPSTPAQPWQLQQQPYPFLSSSPKMWQQQQQPYTPAPSTSGHGRPVHSATLPPQQSWQPHQQAYPPLPSPGPGPSSAPPQQQSYISMPLPSLAQPGNLPSAKPASASEEPQKAGEWSQAQWPPPEWKVRPSNPEQQSLYTGPVQSQLTGLGRASTYTASYTPPAGQYGSGRASSAHTSYQQPGPSPTAPPHSQGSTGSNPGSYPSSDGPSFGPSFGPSPGSPQIPPQNHSEFQSQPTTGPYGTPPSQFHQGPGDGYFNMPQQQQQQHYQQQHAPSQQYPHPPQHHNTYPGAVVGPGYHSPPLNEGLPGPYGPGPGAGFPGPQIPPSMPIRPYGSSLPPPPPHPGNSSYNQPPPGGPSFPTAPSTDSPFGFALNAVDRLAGEERRKQLEKSVGSLAQTGSKLFSKFTK